MQWLPERRHQRMLVIAIIIALGFGAYFLRPFLTVIVLSVVMAYIFYPVFKWFLRRTKSRGAAASLTFLLSLFMVLIPLGILGFLTVLQAENILQLISSHGIDLKGISDRAVHAANNILTGLPGGYHISQSQIVSGVNHLLSNLTQGVLNLLRASINSVAAFFVTAVIYVYLFVNMLVYSDTLTSTITCLNPLGEAATKLYLAKMGAMTTAMVRGQFVIAACQGLLSALVIHFAGLHHVFFFLFLLLTMLSIIPLGAGIVSIPIGIYLVATGHIIPGIIVLAFHFVVVTNIDNLLRPHLVPRDARLNSALTILSVFAGISMFGFLGVVIGPVIMIMITTTVDMYLKVQKTPTVPADAKPAD